MKLAKILLLGLICLSTINWTYTSNTSAFEHPRKTSKLAATYKGEVYQFDSSRIALVPFITKGYSLISMDEYYMWSSKGKLLKGVMIISIYGGPAFRYTIVDYTENEGFGLIDTNCNGVADVKTGYGEAILIPGCLYKYRTNETG
jgi:hypothetical protein